MQKSSFFIFICLFVNNPQYLSEPSVDVKAAMIAHSSVPAHPKRKFPERNPAPQDAGGVAVRSGSPLGPGSDGWRYLGWIGFGLISVHTHDSSWALPQSPCSVRGIPEFHSGYLGIASPRCADGPGKFGVRGEVGEEIRK